MIPATCFTSIKVASSVIRRLPLYFGTKSRPEANLSSKCREPCTKTKRKPKLANRFKSAAKRIRVSPSNRLSVTPTTMVLPRKY